MLVLPYQYVPPNNLASAVVRLPWVNGILTGFLSVAYFFGLLGMLASSWQGWGWMIPLGWLPHADIFHLVGYLLILLFDSESAISIPAHGFGLLFGAVVGGLGLAIRRVGAKKKAAVEDEFLVTSQ